MEELYNSLDEVINCIKDSLEYRNCIELKNKMDNNEELKKTVQQIKLLQKKYIRSNYDSLIKVQLDELEDRLNSIPIYVVYLQNLDKVNQKIDYVKESLNDYFDGLLNEKY